jgi:hypothetical protein
VFLFPTGLVRIQLGQTVYSSLAAAVAGSQTEQFVEYSLNRENAILIGIISLNKNATLLNNSAQAVFDLVSKFGEVLGGTGGLSTTTLQQAYDNSVQPEITTNPTLGAVSFKQGSGSNADRVIEIENGLGVVTMSVDASGRTTTTDLTITGLTINSGLTRFLVVDTSGNTHYRTSGADGTSGTNGTSGTSGTSPTVPGLNNEVLTSDGSGGIVAESNMTFDSTLLNITGRTDIYDTIGNIPSLNIFSQHNYPQHYSLSIHNSGTPTGNTKLYGAEIIVNGASSSNTGIITNAGGDDNGNNTGIDVSNNSTGSGSLQYGIKGSVLGSMTNGLGIKYGSKFEVTNSSQFNRGYSVTVSDATIFNIGYEAFINGTTGNSIGMQVLNTNADTNGGDSQTGALINVLGGGSFLSTNKIGLSVNVNGSAQSNIGLRSFAGGASQNYAIYTSGGRFSFYHDPK